MKLWHHQLFIKLEMIKIKVRKNSAGKSEIIRLLKNGEFRCTDETLLKFVLMLAEDFDGAGGCAYSDRQHAKMQWIAEQLGGKITHYDEDKRIYPPDVCFAAM